MSKTVGVESHGWGRARSFLDASEGGAVQPWDSVIVGAGSAGCVLAERLSADPSRRVLLLEAGPRDLSPFVHVPAGVHRLQGMFDWRYQAEPDPSRAGKVDTWNAGRILGGSSSINGMVWTRCSPSDFDYWAAGLGCTGWDYESVLPYFRRAETFHGPADDRYRGRSGPLHVAEQRLRHHMTDAFVDTAQRCGHARNIDYNGPDSSGVAYVQLSQRNGLRHSTARAYLRRAKKRSNLTILTGVQVRRVLFDGLRARGVEYRQGTDIREARSDGEVILSAGGIGSPKLLLASGIGPARHLADHEIGVLVDHPAVGRNLQEHTYALTAWRMNARTLNQETTPLLMLKHGLDFLMCRRGALTSAPVHALVFAGRDEHARPTYEYGFRPFGISAAGPEDHSGKMSLMRSATACCVATVLHPKARGTVSLRSNDPEAPPRLEHTLLGDPDDLRLLRAACRGTREVMRSEPMRHLVVSEQAPGSDVESDDEWDAHLRATAYMGRHPVGTCRMGADPHSVVDPELRVRGVEGLRVIDASVMPELPSGHTNAVAVMIGERGADLVMSAR